MGLISVAAAGAYLALYYKGGMLALVASPFASRRNEHFVAAEMEESEVVEPVSTPEIEVEEETPSNVFVLPTVAQTYTRDSMVMARAEDGAPRIVIQRA